MTRPAPLLPPFLRRHASTEPDPTEPDPTSKCHSAVFTHRICETNVDAHVRWWPSCVSGTADVRTVLLFIPGNPGLLDFYIRFLSALHGMFRDDGLAILAHAHLGHSPHLHVSKRFGLLHQVEAALEVFDAIKGCWPTAKVILVGHSVGSWIATQVLKARHGGVDALFLLFPTISNLARTPNGRRLSWLFNTPIASVISQLSVLIRPISAPVLSLLYPSWPAHQKAVLRSLLSSPQAIFAALTMGHDEMRIITAPDILFLKEYSSKLWLYYADKDNWVGKERETIIGCLGDQATDRIVRDVHGTPHAFCILHSELLASQCGRWLTDGGFIGGQTKSH